MCIILKILRVRMYPLAKCGPSTRQTRIEAKKYVLVRVCGCFRSKLTVKPVAYMKPCSVFARDPPP